MGSPDGYGETAGPGLLHEILGDCQLSIDDFRQLL